MSSGSYKHYTAFRDVTDAPKVDVDKIRQERSRSHIETAEEKAKSQANINAKPLPSYQKEEKKEYTGFAKGGEVNLDFKQFKKLSSDEHSTIMRHPAGHELRINHYAEGGVVEQDMEQASMPIAEDPGLTQELNTPVPNAMPGYGQPQQGQQAPMGPSNFEIPVQQQNNAQYPQMSTDPIQSALSQQEQGAQSYANAQGQQGNAEAKIARDSANAQQQIMSRFSENMQKYSQEADNVIQDLRSGHIDAGRYMKNLSTSSQVSAAIGLVLGGLGAGLAGGENQALKVLQNNIDRDVQAQIHDKQNKQNLFQGLMQQMGNERDATSMLQVITTGAYASKLQEAAAKSKSPMAQAIAEKSIGDLRMSVAPMMQQLAFKQAIRQGLQQGALTPEVAVQALVPEVHQKAVYAAIEKAENAAKAEPKIVQTFRDLEKEATIARTMGGLRTPPSRGVLLNLLAPLAKDAYGNLSDSDNARIESFAPAAGDMDSTLKTKFNGMMNFIHSKQAEGAKTAKGFGIDLEQFKSTRQAPEGVRPNPNAPKRK